MLLWCYMFIFHLKFMWAALNFVRKEVKSQ